MDKLNEVEVVVVEWFKHMTENAKVVGSIPASALMSFYKAFIYITLWEPRVLGAC